MTKGVKVYGFGEDAAADIRLTDCLEAANGSRIKAHVLREDVELTLLIPGRHIAVNALSEVVPLRPRILVARLPANTESNKFRDVPSNGQVADHWQCRHVGQAQQGQATR